MPQKRDVFRGERELGRATGQRAGLPHCRRQSRHHLLFCSQGEAYTILAHNSLCWRDTSSRSLLQVACTNWKRVMFALLRNNTGPYEDPLSFLPEWVHDNEQLPFLSRFPKPERIVRSCVYICNVPLCTLCLVILVYALSSAGEGEALHQVSVCSGSVCSAHLRLPGQVPKAQQCCLPENQPAHPAEVRQRSKSASERG